MNEPREEDPPMLALPRPRMVPCDCSPLTVGLTRKAVALTHADLAAHAGGANVAGVLCVSSTFALVETGGARFPEATRLYTGKPMVLHMWPGDVLRLTAVKPGSVLLLPLAQSKRGDPKAAPLKAVADQVLS